MEAVGSPFTTLCQCSVLRILKAIATRIRNSKKSKQTLKSPRIELGPIAPKAAY